MVKVNCKGCRRK